MPEGGPAGRHAATVKAKALGLPQLHASRLLNTPPSRPSTPPREFQPAEVTDRPTRSTAPSLRPAPHCRPAASTLTHLLNEVEVFVAASLAGKVQLLLLLAAAAAAVAAVPGDGHTGQRQRAAWRRRAARRRRRRPGGLSPAHWRAAGAWCIASGLIARLGPSGLLVAGLRAATGHLLLLGRRPFVGISWALALRLPVCRLGHSQCSRRLCAMHWVPRRTRPSTPRANFSVRPIVTADTERTCIARIASIINLAASFAA